MNLLDKYFVAFPRSPDDPAAPEPAPAADPPAPAPVATDPPAADPIADPPEPAPAPKPAPQMVPVTVVAELRGKARNLESELAAANRRAADAEALAARLAKGDKPDPAVPGPRAPAPAPASDDEVDRRAEQKLFERDVNAVRDAGIAQYGAAQFNDTIRALAAYGADDDAFVSQALAVARGNSIPAHQLLHDLAQNGEKTVALVGMSPTQRIAELTRMAMAAAPKAKDEPKPEPKVEPKPASAVSRAPAPKPAIAPVAAPPEVDPRTPEGNEKMTDAEWEAWYKKTYIKKSA